MTPISPACPIPIVFDPVRHVQELKNCLNPNHPGYCFVERIHINIRAIVTAYKTGQMPAQGTVYLKHSRMVPESEGKIRDALV